MPLSSVLGASSVIKPGVCTSTTRPTVPYTGQLIFETDTSRLAVWTGSAWQYESAAAGPPGLVYITGASFTTVTSVSLPVDTFTSTYRNYRVIVDGLNSASGSAVTLRMRNSGTDNTTSNYFGSVSGTAVGGGADLQGSNSVTAFNLQQTSVNAIHYTFDVIAPQVTTTTQWSGTFLARSGSGITAGTFIGMFLASTSFDSLSIIAAGGTTFTGTYRVYGYTDS